MKILHSLLLIKILSATLLGVIYSTLLLYMTNCLKVTDLNAINLFSSFFAYVAIMRIIGGWLGNKVLSYRILLLLGAISCIFGNICLCTPSLPLLHLGITALTIGFGFMVAINCILTESIKENHFKRENAFLINYSGMNIGWFIGFLISGYYELNHAYHELFLISSLISTIYLFVICFFWKKIQTQTRPFSAYQIAKGISFILLIFVTLTILYTQVTIGNRFIVILSMILTGCLCYYTAKHSSLVEKNKLYAFLALSFIAVIYWTIYHLTPMVLTLFVERNLNKQYGYLTLTPQWVQLVSTGLIVIAGPILAYLFRKNAKQKSFKTPFKFSIAIILMGLSIFILASGIHYADSLGLMHFNWMIASMGLQAISELLIAPIGYAMVGQLVPMRWQGIMMGGWMLTIGVGSTLSGYLSQFIINRTVSANPLISNTYYNFTFNLTAAITIIIGFILLCLSPKLTYLMQPKCLLPSKRCG